MLREPVTQLGFDDVTRQGLAYDTGNIPCSIPVTACGGAWTVSCVLKPMASSALNGLMHTDMTDEISRYPLRCGKRDESE